MKRQCLLPKLAILLALAVSFGTASPRALGQESRPSVEERITRLEKLLAETRAELAAAREKPADEARLQELDRKIEVLAKEMESLRIGEAAVPDAQRSRFGLGPAASKVYSAKKGVSIGGYGEILYENFASSRQDGAPSGLTDRADLLRAVLYFGYKFSDRFVLNSEVEFEHAVTASDKSGETEVEFAYLDYLHTRAFNVRAGLVLIPVGLINELHEPPTFVGSRRPDVEQVIIPSTWRELGVGVYGETGLVSYRAYLVNGLDASRYAPDGIREGSQEGSEALAHDIAFTGRVDLSGVPGLLVGASLFTGNSSQGRTTPSGRSFSGRTTLFDLHGEWRWRGLALRALYARTKVEDASEINELNGLAGDESVGSRQTGWYLQAGFDLLSLRAGATASLTPFARYEEYDSQAEVPEGFTRNPENDVKELTLGVAFKPIENIVIKSDWQRRQDGAETGVNQWNVALGYLF